MRNHVEKFFLHDRISFRNLGLVFMFYMINSLEKLIERDLNANNELLSTFKSMDKVMRSVNNTLIKNNTVIEKNSEIISAYNKTSKTSKEK